MVCVGWFGMRGGVPSRYQQDQWIQTVSWWPHTELPVILITPQVLFSSALFCCQPKLPEWPRGGIHRRCTFSLKNEEKKQAKKPSTWRGVMLLIDCRWLRCRHRLNLHYHLYEVFGMYPCLINSTIKAKAKINSTFCFHSSNAEILLSKYFDDKKSRPATVIRRRRLIIDLS